MDAKFLEFLGNLLVGSARNKQQSDQFFQWLQSGFPVFNDPKSKEDVRGSNELLDMLNSWYGLDKNSSDAPEYTKLSEEAFSRFNESMKESFFSMGFVPRSEHLELVEKYEQLKAQKAELEEKHKDLEETIEHLKMLLQGQTDMTNQFQEMISKQGMAYQEMVKQFSTLFPDSKKGSD